MPKIKYSPSSLYAVFLFADLLIRGLIFSKFFFHGFHEKPRISVEISHLFADFLGKTANMNREFSTLIRGLFRKTANKYLFTIFILKTVDKYFSADFLFAVGFKTK